MSGERSSGNLASLRQQLDEAEDLLNAVIDSQQDAVDKEHRQGIVASDKLSLWQENQELRKIVKNKEAEVQHLNFKIEKILNSVRDGLIILDSTGTIIFANKATIDLLKYSKEQLIGHPLKNFLLQEETLVATCENERQFLIQQATTELGFSPKEYTAFLTRDDEKLPVEYNTVLVDGEHDVGAVISFQDISKRIETERQLTHEISFDNLTQIPNQYLFEQIIRHNLIQAERENTKLALIYFDINNLAAINQAYGFIAGNCLLKDIVARIKLHLRKSDLIARISGNVFAIYIGTIKAKDDAAIAAKKIQQLMSEPFKVNGEQICVQTRMGITTYPEHASDTESFLKNAQSAMYAAKEENNSSVRFYTHQLTQDNIEYLTLEADIHNAIDAEQFTLTFLPQHDVKEGKIIAIESLIRWNHPERGLLFPAKFLPVINSQNLSQAFFSWIISTSLSEFIKISQQCIGDKLYLSINLSEKDFLMPDLALQIKGHLEDHRINPGLLQLEIPEMILMKNISYSQEVLQQLKDVGVRLVIDDFGLAHCSLFYLNRLSVDELKIDTSFIQHLEGNEIDKATVKAIIQLGHSLGLTVTAEGVENQHTANFLKQHCCDYVQGYHFSPPLELDKLISKLNRK